MGVCVSGVAVSKHGLNGTWVGDRDGGWGGAGGHKIFGRFRCGASTSIGVIWHAHVP